MGTKLHKTKKGYVYVLSNPSMPGIVKIGRTTRDPDVRVNELNSASGVALPFKLEAAIDTNDPTLVERLIHQRIGNKRVNKKREFFHIGVADAIKLSKSIAKTTNSKFYQTTSARMTPSALCSYVLAILLVFTWVSLYSPMVAWLWLPLSFVVLITKWPKYLCEALSITEVFGFGTKLIIVILAITPLSSHDLREALLRDLVTFYRWAATVI